MERRLEEEESAKYYVLISIEWSDFRTSKFRLRIMLHQEVEVYHLVHITCILRLTFISVLKVFLEFHYVSPSEMSTNRSDLG